MIFRRPCYYDDFLCKAEKCTDNCCIGWEICIDGDTLKKYQKATGAFGLRLRESIRLSDEASFILKNDRCPFLNEKNLCDIIINMGKDHLCQICRDHPRYFEWYGSIKEGGIGLSCEEGARLILTDSCYTDYFESETDEKEDTDFDENTFGFLFSVRERIFDILSDISLPLQARFCEILSLGEGTQLILDGKPPSQPTCFFSFEQELSDALSILKKTEPIDESWTNELSLLELSIKQGIDLSSDYQEDKFLERLFAYFIWRYFLKSIFDFQVTEKIRFALFSVTVIFALYKTKNEKSLDALLKSAVIYSKQMEYSEENLDVFYNAVN